MDYIFLYRVRLPIHALLSIIIADMVYLPKTDKPKSYDQVGNNNHKYSFVSRKVSFEIISTIRVVRTQDVPKLK